jgi:hypothetical protein
MRFSDWLFEQVGRRASINLKLLAELLFRFLTEEQGISTNEAGTTVAGDYVRGGRSDLPTPLKPFFAPTKDTHRVPTLALKRQQRFLGHGKGSSD